MGKETIDFYNTSDTRGTSQFYGLNYQKTGFLQRMTKDIHTKMCLQIFGEKYMANRNYELRYLLLFYRDLEEKIVYIAETLQNPQAANNLLDDEPNEGWCMMLLKPM